MEVEFLYIPIMIFGIVALIPFCSKIFECSKLFRRFFRNSSAADDLQPFPERPTSADEEEEDHGSTIDTMLNCSIITAGQPCVNVSNVIEEKDLENKCL